MNCDEFDKRLEADPYDEDERFRDHLTQCTRCQARYADAMNFEKKLAEAFRVDPEQDFNRRLAQKCAVQIHQGKKRKFRKLAFAAGIFIVIAASLFSVHVYNIRSLPDFVLAHIDHEFEFLTGRVTVQQPKLRFVFDMFDSQYLAVLPNVTYVEKCWMRTGFGLHLIFQGSYGPVTFLLMPDESIDTVININTASFSGKIYPAQQGSFAIVGVPGESVELLAERVRMAML